MNERKYAIPIWKKYSLNFSEAAEYFGIGEKKLRQIVADHPDRNFILEIGSHIRLKRQKLSEFLDETEAI